MKIGKEEIFAIVECVLFLLGAIFFAVAWLDSATPIWALVMGILCAVSGVTLWLRPWIIKGYRSIKNNLAEIKTARAAAKTPQTETKSTDYELHRPTTYDQNSTAKKPDDLDLDF